MKKITILLLFITFAISANVNAQSLNGQSMNGSTGLYSIPTGRVGWDDTKEGGVASNGGNFAFDLGYRAIINNSDGVSHIPAATFTFIKWIELSVAHDFQPKIENKRHDDDLLTGLKVKIPSVKETGIVIGANVQFNNIYLDGGYRAYQPYLAITYPGKFFNMPAEATIVVGKTFYEKNNNSNIDFGMGFDLVLFPDILGNFAHYLIDFANFGYSDNSWPHGSSWYRGILSTGFRIDLSAIPAFNRMKFIIDASFNDLFDAGGRSFAVGAVLGFSTKPKK